jgi:hypothetical protein
MSSSRLAKVNLVGFVSVPARAREWRPAPAQAPNIVGSITVSMTRCTSASLCTPEQKLVALSNDRCIPMVQSNKRRYIEVSFALTVLCCATGTPLLFLDSSRVIPLSFGIDKT